MVPHATLDTISPWVARWAHLIPPDASVLDVACGGGRHTRYFAARGCRVMAVDRDPAAIAALQDVADARVIDLEIEDTVAAWADARRANTGAGLEASIHSVDAIIVTNYLHRPLLPLLANALNPGGVLLYETFAMGNEAYGKPSRPAFLLQPDELLGIGDGLLTTVAFEQGLIEHVSGAKSVVQRLCAVCSAKMMDSICTLL